MIGGLAVMSRLTTVHRATQDVDAVSEEGPHGRSFVHALVSSDVAVAGGGANEAVVDGVTIQVIPTDAVPSDLEGTDDDLLFLLAHRWALDTAEPMTLSAGPDAVAHVPVATPAALVCTKLHALVTRRAGQEPKRASDAYDVLRLLQTFDVDAGIGQAVREGPPRLAAVVTSMASTHLVTDAERTYRWMRVHGGDEARAFTADDVRRAGALLIEGLEGGQP